MRNLDCSQKSKNAAAVAVQCSRQDSMTGARQNYLLHQMDRLEHFLHGNSVCPSVNYVDGSISTQDSPSSVCIGAKDDS